ncbi:MAG: SAM-dependent methyltransferase [Gammaproteobacteria bacterium]
MSQQYSEAVKTAQEYYNSNDADNFYFHIWGGEDIHIGLYQDKKEDIATASQRTVARMASKITDISPDSRVIDLGSGYGGAARWLANNFGCHVTCINLSEAQNERNRQLTEEAGLTDKIEVIDASFEQIPCEAHRFDLVWSQDAILHSGNRTKVLFEIDRVLQPGGEIVFTDPMQADNCLPGVLQPILDRIHLDSLASFAYYRQEAKGHEWEELEIENLTPQLVNHYSRVREELIVRRAELEQHVSKDYIDRMIAGLGHWIEAGKKGYLAWGIMHFQKSVF